MSTTHPYRKLSRELKTYNDRLEDACRREFGVSLRTFKTIKATAVLIGVVGVFWTVTLTEGTDPELAAIIVGFMIAGSELAEYFLQARTQDE